MTPKTAKEWVKYFSGYPEDELIGISSIADRDDFNDYIINIEDDEDSELREAIKTKDMKEVYRKFIINFEKDEYLNMSAWETKGDILHRLLSQKDEEN